MATALRCRVCESTPGWDAWNLTPNGAARHTEKTGHSDFRTVKAKSTSGSEQRRKLRKRERETIQQPPALNRDLEQKLRALRAGR